MSRRGASLVTDLVCGMRVRPEDAARTEDYDGHTFYFCSVACQEQFADDRDFYTRVAEPIKTPR